VDLVKTDRSEALFAAAKALLPGGVSSPVRAFRHVGGTPLFFARGAGAHVWDADGNELIDYCMSWGPLALGHAPGEVVEAVRAAAGRGLSFGTPTEAELDLARTIARLHPAAERVRFVSTGTEAVMSAVRLARAFTGRDLVVKFDGCYHGHADYLLVKAGSGLATAGQPDSAGVPAAIAGTAAVLPLDDERAFGDLMTARGREVAAVLIEGIPANAGLLAQRPEFLRAIARGAREAGALFILDEVITGFRLGPAGACGAAPWARGGLLPDLVTFGKVIGGGLPVGAYAGRADVMRLVAPEGPVYQAGTLSGNPVAMAAGLATLAALEDGGFARLGERADALEAALAPIVAEAALPATLVRRGSIFWLVFQREAPRAWHEVDRAGARRYAIFHRALLERGVYFPPSAYEVFFVSTEHGDRDIARTATAVREALAAAAEAGG
jgi:glutamate-1-semialdehyde 2,1-aminomutase